MLAERIEQWTRAWKHQGLEEGKIEGEAEGRIKGEANALLKQLNLKFGQLPDRVTQQVDTAGMEQLDIWVEQVLTARSLEEMFFRE